jgi:predicted TIM-barrel fold metal-dependent hydrolase
LAIDTTKKMNDHMANFFVKSNPGRFLGFAAVPMQDPAAAAKELVRAVKELGFVGALIVRMFGRSRILFCSALPLGKSLG